MSITENNVYQKLHRARQKIKKQIEKLSGKGTLFAAAPLSAVLANLENAGLLSGAAIGTAAAVGAEDLSKKKVGSPAEMPHRFLQVHVLFQLFLHRVPDLRFHDGLVIVFEVNLINKTRKLHKQKKNRDKTPCPGFVQKFWVHLFVRRPIWYPPFLTN